MPAAANSGQADEDREYFAPGGRAAVSFIKQIAESQRLVEQAKAALARPDPILLGPSPGRR
jgi:hypothetical protein